MTMGAMIAPQEGHKNILASVKMKINPAKKVVKIRSGLLYVIRF